MDKLEAMTRQSRWDTHRWWDFAFAAATIVIAIMVDSLANGSAKHHAAIALAVLALSWIFLGRKPVVVRPQQRVGGANTSGFSPTASITAAPYFWSGAAFATIMVCSVGVLSYSLPDATNLLVFACPYLWGWPEGRGRFAVSASFNAVICVVAALALAAHSEWSSDGTTSAVFIGSASLLFSLAMGLWFGHMAREAEERGRLQVALDATNEELVQAHRSAGASMERERFAHELHDTLTQTLTAMVMLTERARGELDRGDLPRGTATLATAESTARQALAETRSLIAEGHGVELGGKQFVQRVSDICGRFEDETGIAVERDIAGSLDSLPRPDQVVLLRCLQETLSNVAKHARASCVVVELTENAEDGAYLAVTDDGTGFPESVSAAQERGYGLIGIASRLALSAGTMNITTGAEGTRVSVTVPGTDGNHD